MATKRTIENRASPFGQHTVSKRALASRTSYVTVVFFHYKRQNFGVPTNCLTPDEQAAQEGLNLQVVKGVIEEEISSLSISKSVDQISGSFEFRLLPSQNWKQVLSPGDWVMIYMHDKSEAKEKFTHGRLPTDGLLLLGNIDRVARSLEKDQESDKTQLRYVVSGRNFGKVFEESDIWFDPTSIQTETLQKVALATAGLESTGTPTDIVKNLIDIFLGGGGTTVDGRIPDLNNWKIPFELARAFNPLIVPSPKFYNILDKKIEPDLPGFMSEFMITVDSNGSLGDLLKRGSNSLVNQLYFEEVRSTNGNVNPTVVLGPRPYNTPFFNDHFGTRFAARVDNARAALNNKIVTTQQLARTNFVEINQAEIKYEDLGKDDHSKFNLFLIKTEGIYRNIAGYDFNMNKKYGIANPLLIKNYIERSGLKRLDQTTGFFQNTKIRTQEPDIDLTLAFLAQAYDMHFANHLYDSGTIEATGVLEAELGKALVVLPDPNIKSALPKVYYIQAYEHHWSFPHHWSTTFTVTHGQWGTIDKNIFIDASKDDYGQPDAQLDQAYLSKTNQKR